MVILYSIMDCKNGNDRTRKTKGNILQSECPFCVHFYSIPSSLLNTANKVKLSIPEASKTLLFALCVQGPRYDVCVFNHMLKTCCSLLLPVCCVVSTHNSPCGPSDHTSAPRCVSYISLMGLKLVELVNTQPIFFV